MFYFKFKNLSLRPNKLRIQIHSSDTSWIGSWFSLFILCFDFFVYNKIIIKFYGFLYDDWTQNRKKDDFSWVKWKKINSLQSCIFKINMWSFFSSIWSTGSSEGKTSSFEERDREKIENNINVRSVFSKQFKKQKERNIDSQ